MLTLPVIINNGLAPFAVLPALCFFLLFPFAQNGFADTLDVWKWRNPLPQGDSVRAIIFAQSKFAAVTDSACLLSEDGFAWTIQPLEPSRDLAGLAFGNGTFVAIGSLVWTSIDGTERWTPKLRPEAKQDFPRFA